MTLKHHITIVGTCHVGMSMAVLLAQHNAVVELTKNGFERDENSSKSQNKILVLVAEQSAQS